LLEIQYILEQERDTIYFRAGTYTDQLAPANSGSNGSPITFEQYQSEIIEMDHSHTYGTIYLNGVDWIVIDGFTCSGQEEVVKHIYGHNGANNIEVKNCDFEGSTGYSGIGISYCFDWHIHDNTFGYNDPSGEDPYDDTACVVASNGGRHYIHDNTFTDCGTHTCLSFGDGNQQENDPEDYIYYCVVKDNTFHNANTTRSGVGLEVDVMTSALKGTRYTLWEGNTYYESGSAVDTDHTAAFKVSSGGVGNIFRQNKIYNMDQFTGQVYSGGYQSVQYNMFYNNTSYNNMVSGEYTGEGAWGVYSGRCYTENWDAEYNQYVNNIISVSGWRAEGGRDDCSRCCLHDNIFRGNHLYSISHADEICRHATGMSILAAETSYPAEYHDNTTNDTTDPKMTDPGNADFTLQSDSPCIDAGVWLTTITSASGSGTTFIVDNPYFFFDGYDISGLTGDVIRLEDGDVATITDVNYGSGAITVDPSVSWDNGDGVALNYNGSGPDIGALEYQGEDTPTVTVAATDADAAEEGSATGTWTISCSPNCTGETINYSFSGAAILDTDYNCDDEDGSIAINGASDTITLTPVDDSDPEVSETATLTVTSGTGYTVGSPASDNISIVDNDEAQESGVSGASGLGSGTGKFTYDSSGSGSYAR